MADDDAEAKRGRENASLW